MATEHREDRPQEVVQNPNYFPTKKDRWGFLRNLPLAKLLVKKGATPEVTKEAVAATSEQIAALPPKTDQSTKNEIIASHVDTMLPPQSYSAPLAEHSDPSVDLPQQEEPDAIRPLLPSEARSMLWGLRPPLPEGQQRHPLSEARRRIREAKLGGNLGLTDEQVAAITTTTTRVNPVESPVFPPRELTLEERLTRLPEAIRKGAVNLPPDQIPDFLAWAEPLAQQNQVRVTQSGDDRRNIGQLVNFIAASNQPTTTVGTEEPLASLPTRNVLSEASSPTPPTEPLVSPLQRIRTWKTPTPQPPPFTLPSLQDRKSA